MLRAAEPTRTSGARKGTRKRRKSDVTPYLFVLPVMLSLIFLFYNLGLTLYQSFREYKFAFPSLARFNNFGNYRRLFLTDPMIGQSLLRSLIWVGGTVSLAFLLGFMLAFLLNQDFWGRGLYRAAILSPWAISGIVSVMTWGWILNGSYGVLNDMLLRWGWIDRRIYWLSDPSLAMPSVIVSSVWRGIPFFAVTTLAGLQSIPQDLYEAAVVDGAGAWAKFRYVTIPMIKGVLVITTMLQTIWAFNWIENIYAMTGGGPGYATTTWAYYLFRQFFDFGDIGYSCAMGVTLMIGLLIFSILYLKVTAVVESTS